MRTKDRILQALLSEFPANAKVTSLNEQRANHKLGIIVGLSILIIAGLLIPTSFPFGSPMDKLISISIVITCAFFTGFAVNSIRDVILVRKIEKLCKTDNYIYNPNTIATILSYDFDWVIQSDQIVFKVRQGSALSYINLFGERKSVSLLEGVTWACNAEQAKRIEKVMSSGDVCTV